MVKTQVVTVLCLIVGISHTNADSLWQNEITDNFETIDHETVFQEWMTHFNKEYNEPKEYDYRYNVFLNNWRYVNTFNLKNEHSYTVRMNKFGDWTVDEFNTYVSKGMKGRNNPRISKLTHKRNSGLDKIDFNKLNAPASLDWTNMNGSSYVTPVKDQGNCGSCWAFSTVGSLESFYAIQNGVTGSAITQLSEQQLVDCTYHVPDGCQGGLQEDGFDYIAKEGGLCTETEYPYTARDGTCYDSTCGKLYNPINGYLSVKKNNETALVDALVIGPIAVSVNAAGVGWQFYSGGVYDGECGPLLDHGIVGVGYGTQTNGGDYWKIKNSWGTSWGMQGYMLICRNCNKNGDRGECGILEDNTYPQMPK